MYRILLTYSVLFVFLTVSAKKNSRLFNAYLENSKTSLLQDFSYAGYQYNEVKIPNLPTRMDVTTRGIHPNTGEDLTEKVQALIEETGKSGGGVLYFPAGRYCFNMDTTKVQYLKIDYSNIVIRGVNSSKQGTVFYSGAITLQEDMNPWISPFLIRFGDKIQSTKLFWGVLPKKPGPDGSEETVIDKAEILTQVTANAFRGDTKLSLQDASQVRPGDVIVVAMYNTTKEGNLIQQLLNYTESEITPDLENARFAGIKEVASFQWMVEVKTVENNNTITLCQPLRCDIHLQFKPEIARAPMIREVGIENIRFESAWDGVYLHHGGGKHSERISSIMDYGWNAVNFCRVAHGWMRNVVIHNYTNPLYIQDSRNVTIDNLTLEGPHGHSGIKIYGHAADNLIKNVRYKNNFTHIISAEGNAYGNVFSRIHYDIADSIQGRCDFHGFAHITYSPPAWNLIELMDGVSRIDGGGSPRNFPHTAKQNVWWNCTAGGLQASSELFTHWVWKKHNRTDHHIMYPASIIAGYRGDKYDLLINGSTHDRDERLIVVESLNEQVSPLSLFESQLKKRLDALK